MHSYLGKQILLWSFKDQKGQFSHIFVVPDVAFKLDWNINLRKQSKNVTFIPLILNTLKEVVPLQMI